MSKKKQLKTVSSNNIVTLDAAQAISPVQAALQSGADPDQLLKFMELQERYDANEAKKAFVLAMSKFRADCPTIEKTEDGHNCKYATIAGTLAQIKALLAEHGLSHSWRMTQENQLITVTCIVTHSMGHSEQTSITAPPDTAGSIKGIQGIGSTITYLERYTLTALLGLASGEKDDDGQAAIGSAERITEDQELTLHSMLTDAGMDADKFERYASRTIGAAGFADIRADQYDYVVKLANDAIKMKQEKDNADNS